MPTATTQAVDPANIPETMSKPQLEWWILFTIAVAGKPAKMIEQKMISLLDSNPSMWGPDATPFQRVRYFIHMKQLGRQLHRVKIGKYKLLNKGFRAAVSIDVDRLASDDPHTALETLMRVPGLGPKGARMILMYAFPEHANLWAVLDTHVLRWLRERGYDAPKSTPSGRRYLELETAFRHEAYRWGKTMRELDTLIWNTYSKLSGDPSQGFNP